MAVTVGDPNASDKTNRFVGICISRGGTGLRAWFNLRNVIDHQGKVLSINLYHIYYIYHVSVAPCMGWLLISIVSLISYGNLSLCYLEENSKSSEKHLLLYWQGWRSCMRCTRR